MKVTNLTNSALFLLFLSIILCQSCVNTKNVAYFQDVPLAQQSGLATASIYTEPKIQSDDILAISIFTIEPTTSMAVNQLASQSISYGQASPNQSTSTSGFLVDKNGEIDLSIIGKVKLAGLTTSQARDLVKEKATLVYKDPNVQVRFANFKVTVLGEVSRPAAYTLPNEKISIIDALGLAGDLTIFGKRENVLLIRDNNGKKEFARFDLNSKNLFTHPDYYLKQNDVIYVEPTKGRSAANNAARTQSIAIITSLISVTIAILSRL